MAEERLPIGTMDDFIFGPYDSEAVLDENGNPTLDLDGEIIFDREQNSASFAAYMRNIVTNGVFPSTNTHPDSAMLPPPTNDNSAGLQIYAPGGGMVLTMRPGAIFVNGRQGINPRDAQFTVPEAHPTLGRRDIVVWREGGELTRALVPEYVKGVASPIPQVPQIIRTDDFTDMQLAVITIMPGATQITQANVLDTRMDNEVCGFVVEFIRSFQGQDLFIQYEAFLNEQIEMWEARHAKQRDEWEAAKEQFGLEMHELRLLMGELETATFATINHNFDDWSVRRGCIRRTSREGAIIRETITVVVNDWELATRMTERVGATVVETVTFNPFTFVEGDVTVSSRQFTISKTTRRAEDGSIEELII